MASLFTSAVALINVLKTYMVANLGTLESLLDCPAHKSRLALPQSIKLPIRLSKVV